MPELPEVETIRRQLAPRLEGRAVTDSWAFPSPKFDEAPDAVGHAVTEVGRRGKYLVIGLRPADHGEDVGPVGDDGRPAVRDPVKQLIVHLGMTGRLTTTPGAPPAHPHLRAWWTLDDDTALTFHDVRRFGRIAVVDPGSYDGLPTLAALGPEPDDDAFDAETLRRTTNASRRHIKTLLLSQRPVAGVGNIYADEALWRAGVHPRARHITRAQAARLRDSVRDVIREGIDHGGTTLRDYRDADGSLGTNQHRLDCYGRTGEPCRRCGAPLVGAHVDARATTWCPACQRR